MTLSRRVLLQTTVSAVGAGVWTAAAGQGAAGFGTRGVLEYQDPRLGGRLPRRTWELAWAPPGGDPSVFGPLRDPKWNREFPQRLEVFCPAADVTMPRPPRFVIHTSEPGDARLALRCGAALAHLYWAGADYLGRAHSRPVQVWLAREGEAGGELYRDQIYLFAVQEARSPVEWLRELAHEYSHLLLP
ncbi:MAG: hypothetical protein FJ315_06520, partial [SAR202 cluster bacterium]|nr:hypothetical protein [SAR202 cluster bacterium]